VPVRSPLYQPDRGVLVVDLKVAEEPHMPEPRTRDPRRLLRRRGDRRGAWFRWWPLGCQLRHAAGHHPPGGRREGGPPHREAGCVSPASRRPSPPCTPRDPGRSSRLCRPRALGFCLPVPVSRPSEASLLLPPRERLDRGSSGGRRPRLTRRQGPIESGVQFVCGMDPGGRDPSARGLR
jgi:hypothetical protein